MGDTEKNAISILKHLITDERKKNWSTFLDKL